MKKVSIAILSLLFLSCSLFFASCKKDYDAPPDNSGYDPQIPVTMTIAELQQLPQGLMIDSDDVISGIVVMDDRSGNYYKKIVIQDSTGGIEIEVDQNNLYNDFPIGRKIYVKVKGLFLGNYGQNLQLGYTPDAGGAVSTIPFVLVNEFIVKANFPNPYQVDTLTISQLSAPNSALQYLNKVIAIKDVQFAAGYTGVPYAQPASLASATNLTVEDCNGATIALRNSGYAKFQPALTPIGNGVMVGLYTRYNNTPQIFIRDTTDLHFNGTRCDGTTPEPTVVVSIDSIKSLFTGSDYTLGQYKIRGVVISDKANGNISGGNVVFQGSNTDGGVVLFYGGQPSYVLGDSLEVDISGCTMKLFNGKLEIEGVSASKTTKLAANKSITPKIVTIAEVLASPKKYESTLVKIENVSWVGSPATYNGSSGNLNITDGTGNLSHYSALGASFKDDPLPPAPVKMTGFIDIHNSSAQIRMRNPNPPINDVQ